MQTLCRPRYCGRRQCLLVAANFCPVKHWSLRTTQLLEAPEDDPFVDLAVGPTHTVALTSDGVVYTWGDGAFGALGNNSTTSSTSAVDVEFPQVDDDFFDVPEFTQVAAGTSFSFAINSEGRTLRLGGQRFWATRRRNLYRT